MTKDEATVKRALERQLAEANADRYRASADWVKAHIDWGKADAKAQRSEKLIKEMK